MMATLPDPDMGAFLGAPTPPVWVDAALDALDVIIVDHANCEKKAAASALALMNRYGDRRDLVQRLSRLAREELRHFEQVRKLMDQAGFSWRQVSAARYGRALRDAADSGEPGRLVDLLLIGAFIEARSCERFALLAPRLSEPLASFYRGLLASEARHYRHYLGLARQYRRSLSGPDVDRRAAHLRRVENALICEPDGQIRFHSGPPAA
jgi:tRNA-(ms[2]io[6]A)-hydroxylase